MIARFLFENSPWSAFWSAWFVGYAVVGGDGQVYRTADGQAYLDSIDAALNAEAVRAG